MSFRGGLDLKMCKDSKIRTSIADLAVPKTENLSKIMGLLHCSQ